MRRLRYTVSYPTHIFVDNHTSNVFQVFQVSKFHQFISLIPQPVAPESLAAPKIRAMLRIRSKWEKCSYLALNFHFPLKHKGYLILNTLLKNYSKFLGVGNLIVCGLLNQELRILYRYLASTDNGKLIRKTIGHVGTIGYNHEFHFFSIFCSDICQFMAAQIYIWLHKRLC